MDTQSCCPTESLAREPDGQVLSDTELADFMARLTGLDLHSPDGCAEGQGILREMESLAPGTLARMQAGLALRRAGASLLTEARLSDA